MPIYEFKCENCGYVEELLMKISEPAPQACSQCQGPLHKLVSQTSFSLKGAGWYVTDYKKSDPSDTKPQEATSPITSEPSTTNTAQPAITDTSATKADVASPPSTSTT